MSLEHITVSICINFEIINFVTEPTEPAGTVDINWRGGGETLRRL
jgi:hypothetical protein